MAVCILRTVIQFSATVKESFTYSHWEAASDNPKREKYLRIWNTLSLICTRGIQMHTHFWDFPRQIFSLPKISPHLFGIAKPNDTLFYRKRRKNFFGCGCFILLPSKSLFTYSHWEGANSNPVSKNILLFAKPLHLFGIRRLKRNLFFKKTEKIFWKNCLSQKHPLTCSHWQRTFGDSNFEKG